MRFALRLTGLVLLASPAGAQGPIRLDTAGLDAVRAGALADPFELLDRVVAVGGCINMGVGNSGCGNIGNFNGGNGNIGDGNGSGSSWI